MPLITHIAHGNCSNTRVYKISPLHHAFVTTRHFRTNKSTKTSQDTPSQVRWIVSRKHETEMDKGAQAILHQNQMDG